MLPLLDGVDHAASDFAENGDRHFIHQPLPLD